MSKPTRTPALARVTQLLSFGALCVAGSFVLGIQTAGDLQPILNEQADAVEVVNTEFPYTAHVWRGSARHILTSIADRNANERIDATDILTIALSVIL